MRSNESDGGICGSSGEDGGRGGGRGGGGAGTGIGTGGKVPGDARERSIWVQGRLRLRACSFAAIARELGISGRAVGQAMYAPNHRVEQAIASHLDMEPRILFQERYHPDGTRLHSIRVKAGAA